ncbi:two-component system sensor histidine kinase CreC [Pseudomonas sp. KCJK9016]|uniref:two-component system sensor histidine kinase CreC n=1 Tax=Pseudomonas sp. KCJK9016 TaxID=3344556 RepID=UPI0039060261
MPLGLRIFLVYVLFIGLTGYFVLNTVMEEIRPGVRQSTEETLVDTANLMAEILKDDFKAGTLSQNRWPELLRAYGERQPKATIWGLPKNQVNHRIYVTDAKGIVVLDSSGLAVGQDYSRWNDVYLTLRGEYGARSSRSDPNDPNSSVMHVGAPIRDDGRIIGVVTVAKPNSSLQPYVDRTERRLLAYGAGLIALGLLFGALLSWWLSRALHRLTGYAQAVSEGRRVEVPHYRGGELKQLAGAVEQMRTQLEGKAYVERYVHTLTHELKSPLAAIRGAAELLQSEMPRAQRQRFVGNIDSESARMQQLIERLLDLAQVEQRQALEERVAVPLAALVDEVLHAQAARIESKQLRVECTVAAELTLIGEPFLLRQALGNLLENALDFTPSGGLLRFDAERVGEQVEFCLFNEAEPIPDYALARLTERFYSLPRPESGRKSTGLGLNFVEEVAKLHGGSLHIDNLEGGVQVRLHLPGSLRTGSPSR